MVWSRVVCHESSISKEQLLYFFVQRPPLVQTPLLLSTAATTSNLARQSTLTLSDEQIRASVLSAVEDKMKRRLKEIFAQAQVQGFTSVVLVTVGPVLANLFPVTMGNLS